MPTLSFVILFNYEVGVSLGLGGSASSLTFLILGFLPLFDFGVCEVKDSITFMTFRRSLGGTSAWL